MIPTAHRQKPYFRTHTSQPHLSSVDLFMLEQSMTFKSLSTSGTASSKASSLFDLDEHSSKSILVYKYRSGAKGLEVKSESALCDELDKGKSPRDRPSAQAVSPPTYTAQSQTPHCPSSASPRSPYRAETAV